MQYRDRVLIDTPIPLLFKGTGGAQVNAYVQYADDPATNETVSLSEITTPTGHIRIYAGAYTPSRNGWYYVTFRATLNGVEVGTDATRFYSFTAQEENSSGGAKIGEPTLQEMQVKVGTTARISYRGIPGLTVAGIVVFESELATPSQGVSITFTQQTGIPGYNALYLGSFSPTRAGKYYVYINSSPAGGEGLVVLSSFTTLPFNRAAGTIKTSATSTVL